MNLEEATKKALSKNIDMNQIKVLRDYLKWFDDLDDILESDIGYTVISDEFGNALDEFMDKEIEEKTRVEKELKKLEKDLLD